jgi:hypothetical protein
MHSQPTPRAPPYPPPHPTPLPGGELAFVTALVQDSLALRGAVHWYSTKVGKKATLRAARSLLYRHGVRVLRTTEFCQVGWVAAGACGGGRGCVCSRRGGGGCGGSKAGWKVLFGLC